jgi:hypothetical protein
MRRHKIIRFLTIAIVLFLQSTFLLMIVKEKYEANSISIVALILTVTLVMWLAYRYLDLHHEEHLYEELWVVVWVPAGAVVCYLLNVFCGLGSVLSAGITGTTASFLPSLNPKSEYLKKLPPTIYCGTFVGMSSMEIAPSLVFVVFAAILAGVLLLFSKSLFLGIGGKLGTIAFSAVVIVSLLYWLAK